jgi:ankyrin repeat protein
VRLLLDRGASADVKNKAGRTPLQVALEEGEHEVVEMLTEHGA